VESSGRNSKYKVIIVHKIIYIVKFQLEISCSVNKQNLFIFCNNFTLQ